MIGSCCLPRILRSICHLFGGPLPSFSHSVFRVSKSLHARIGATREHRYNEMIGLVVEINETQHSPFRIRFFQFDTCYIRGSLASCGSISAERRDPSMTGLCSHSTGRFRQRDPQAPPQPIRTCCRNYRNTVFLTSRQVLSGWYLLHRAGVVSRAAA